MRYQNDNQYLESANPVRSHPSYRKTKIAVALSCLYLASSALAEERVLEEVIVTSSKLGEASLGETSFTVNVVGGQDLAARVITNPEDLRTAVSGVYIDEGSSTPRIAIRGVGFDNFQIQAENGVTTYVDNVVIQRTQAVLGAFLDLQQVEVLKGPQGTSFGRNATGGSINLITAKPVPGFSGEVTAGYGEHDRKKFGGVVNYGGDRFGIRVSGLSDEDEGYVTNNVTGNDEINSRENTAARISLSWTPSDTISVDYSYNYSEYEGDGPGQDYTNPEAAAHAAQIGADVFLPFLATPTTSVADDDHRVTNWQDPRSEREADLHILNAEIDFGWATLKSITGYMDFDSYWRADTAAPSAFDGGLISTNFFFADSEQWSQELLLSGSTDDLNWVAGLYYLDEEATDSTNFTFFGASFILDNGQDLTSYAAYTDVQYALNDRWRLNGGVRYTEDEKEAYGASFFVPSLDGTEVEDDVTTWQAGVEYDVSDELFSYLRIAKGYKAGGINNNTGDTYDPEELISVELGLRGDIGDDITFSLAAFTSEYDDIQIFEPTPIGAPNILNAAEATITGLDAELDWQLTDAFSVDAMVTWLAEAEYDEFEALDPVSGEVTDFSGADLTRSPEFTGVFGVNAFFSPTDRIDLSARAEVYVTTDIAFSHLNDNVVTGQPIGFNFAGGAPYPGNRPSGALEQDGYELVNLYVTATIDENLDVRLYGKNITDEFYLTTILEGSAGFQTGVHGRPEEYGIEVTYRFGE